MTEQQELERDSLGNSLKLAALILVSLYAINYLSKKSQGK
jgi:hypothetical protein